jgi:hypothetical protein
MALNTAPAYVKCDSHHFLGSAKKDVHLVMILGSILIDKSSVHPLVGHVQVNGFMIHPGLLAAIVLAILRS